MNFTKFNQTPFNRTNFLGTVAVASTIEVQTTFTSANGIIIYFGSGNPITVQTTFPQANAEAKAQSGGTVAVSVSLNTVSPITKSTAIADVISAAVTLAQATGTDGLWISFLNEPQVDTTGSKANKVTVRSDSASATATTDPAPSPEEVIHTIVTIDSGDATVCQQVADKLIEKWGSEQITVSGDIDLNVQLKFKEKVKVVVPNVDIDKYMMIQKKEHQVTEGVTSITAGDIQLSESELLARILDDLGA